MVGGRGGPGFVQLVIASVIHDTRAGAHLQGLDHGDICVGRRVKW